MASSDNNRELVHEILREHRSESRRQERMRSLSTQLSSDCANAADARRFLAQSVASLIASLPVELQASERTRQFVQQINDDAAECFRASEALDHLRLEHRNLLFRSRERTHRVSRKMEQLAEDNGVVVTQSDMCSTTPSSKATSTGSDEPVLPPLLEAYYDKAQKHEVALRRVADIEADLEEQRADRQFFFDQGKTMEVDDKQFEDEFERRRMEASIRLQVLKEERDLARNECREAGVIIPSESDLSDPEDIGVGSFGLVEALPAGPEVLPTNDAQSTQLAGVGEWLKGVETHARHRKFVHGRELPSTRTESVNDTTLVGNVISQSESFMRSDSSKRIPGKTSQERRASQDSRPQEKRKSFLSKLRSMTKSTRYYRAKKVDVVSVFQDPVA